MVIIADVLSQGGDILQQNEMENIYNIKTYFLEFGRFKFQIEKYLSKYSLTKDQLKYFERPVNTFFHSIINIDRKGANKLYKILNSNNVSICYDLVVK